jgi:hypothetical protein
MSEKEKLLKLNELKETLNKLKDKNKSIIEKCNDELTKQKNEIISLQEKFKECKESKKKLQDINIELTVFTCTEELDEHKDEVKCLAITQNSK